jgi:hypothetical protein
MQVILVVPAVMPVVALAVAVAVRPRLMGLGKTGPTAVVRVVMVGQMDRAVFLAGRVPLTLGLMVARGA